MRPVVAGAALVLLLLLGVVPAQPTSPTADRPPILIEGDADLCDDEDGDGVVGQDDGIVNCATADGSAERPYRIEGWQIRVFEEEACTNGSSGAPPSADCTVPARCVDMSAVNGAVYLGALNLCKTSKHVVIAGLRVQVGEFRGFFETEGEGNGCDAGGCQFRFVGLNLWGASNVTVREVTVEAYSVAVSVRGGLDVEGSPWEATSIRMEDSHIRGMSAVDASQAAALSVGDSEAGRLVTGCNAELSVEDTVLDATGHNAALALGNGLSADCNPGNRLVLSGARVTNAMMIGVSAYGDAVEVRGTTFDDNGVGGASTGGRSTTYAHVFIATDSFVVENNTFVMSRAGVVGVRLETRGDGLIERNAFPSEDAGLTGPGTWPTAVVNHEGFACGARVEYNDIGMMRVVNMDPNCDLSAHRNWWGRASGPSNLAPVAANQIEGRVDAADWLRTALAELPAVVVQEPAPGSVVFGLVTLRGAVQTPQDVGVPVDRVEAVREGTTWDRAVVVNGTDPWRIRWDVGAEPPGPLELRVRACVPDECGFAARLGLEAIRFPLPPTATLRASAHLVAPGEPVVLNASGSYSPQGTSIVAYWFDVHGGGIANWTDAPNTTVSFAEPGAYAPAVVVRDADGFESTRPATVTIRVSAGHHGGGLVSALGEAPGPGFLVASVVLALAAVWRRAS